MSIDARKKLIVMNRTDLEKYYLSMKSIVDMHDEGLISNNEYDKAEAYMAEKYCIKTGNLYRLNHLTIPRTRVIDSVSKEEVNIHEENHHQVRRITQVNKEN
jgi:hypothetical protein